MELTVFILHIYHALVIQGFSLLFYVLKGTMSPQLLAQVDNNNFEIVGPTFSNTVREFRRLLYRIGCKCKGISTDFEKIVYILQKVILVVEIKQIYAGILLLESDQPDSTAHVPQLT